MKTQAITGLILASLVLVGCEPVKTNCVPTSEFRVRPWSNKSSGASMVKEQKYICELATGGTTEVWNFVGSP